MIAKDVKPKVNKNLDTKKNQNTKYDSIQDFYNKTHIHPPDEENFDLIKKKIQDNLMFNHVYYNSKFIKRRVHVRMRHLGLKKYLDYVFYLDKTSAEYIKLNKELTINVTEFFRDKNVFDYLQKELIPSIIKRKLESANKSIYVCSVGCSTGEEPYSLAILFHEILGEDIDKFNIKIFATDYDTNVLISAKVGEYRSSQLANLSEELKEKYFDVVEYQDLKNYKIKDFIKRMVIFKSQDVLSDPSHINYIHFDDVDVGTNNYIKQYKFDIILCRNLVIYFTMQAKMIVYEKIYNSLSQDGIVVLGKTETIVGNISNLFNIINLENRVYVRKN